MELTNQKEKAKIKFQQTQAEKNYFLGEFKENIILAVSKEQLDGKILKEVIDAMKRPETVLLKIRRDIPLKNIKIYISQAEKLKINYRLVDSLSFVGDIGLVVVSKEPLPDDRNIMAKDRSQVYKEVGLPSYFSKAEGKEICDKHLNMIEKKLPNYIDCFKKLSFVDKILGKKCPICEEERKGNIE